MPLVLSTGFGLLVREFYKRLNPGKNHETTVLTRGLYTATKRDVVRRKRIPQQDPFSNDELRFRLGGNCVRRYVSTANIKQENIEWVAVYRFPGIRICSLISRTKFLQTIISVLLIPYQSYQLLDGTISTETFYVSLALAALAPIMLIAFTRYFNRLIGVVAFNEEQQLVRFGYLGFWGGRKNLTVDLADVMPLTDTIDVEDAKPLVKLDLKQHRYLLLTLKKCEIVDEELATEIFGSMKFFKKFEN